MGRAIRRNGRAFDPIPYHFTPKRKNRQALLPEINDLAQNSRIFSQKCPFERIERALQHFFLYQNKTFRSADPAAIGIRRIGTKHNRIIFGHQCSLSGTLVRQTNLDLF